MPSPATTPSRELANSALAFLDAHNLAPKPLNYAVAYEHLSGALPALSAFIGSHLEAGKTLDDILLQDLYDTHIAGERHRQFHGMRNNLQELLQTLLQTLQTSQEHSTAYQQELATSIEALNGVEGADTLQNIAADMIRAAVNANSQNQALQGHLAAAHQETEQLRAELEAQRREAMLDPLTGLFNRRAMAQHLEQLWDNPEAHLSVLVLDIDHFKRINDTYGHAIGDVVIRNVADTVRRSVRGEDIAVRYGGEEFVVLLPNTALEGAITVAETIRKRIEALRLVRKNDNFSLDPFTISLGVAQRGAHDDRDGLIERADRALYQAKTGGRNRVMADAGVTLQ